MADAESSLENLLDSMTTGGVLYEKHAGGSLTCYACGHRCLIKPGRRGICQVRYNQDGELRVPWGYVGALQCDPTEKKPFFHVYPGSDTLTFGMLGCDMHCPYCFPPVPPPENGGGRPAPPPALFGRAARVRRGHRQPGPAGGERWASGALWPRQAQTHRHARLLPGAHS